MEKLHATAAIHGLQVRLKMLKNRERFKSLQNAKRRPFMTWADFVQYPEPHGLGMRLDAVEAIIATVENDKLLDTIALKQP